MVARILGRPSIRQSTQPLLMKGHHLYLKQRLRGLTIIPLAGLLVFLASCGGNSDSTRPAAHASSTPVPTASSTPTAVPTPSESADTDPPEVQVGERLFLDTRFAEFFFANSNGNVNAVLPAGDPVVDQEQTTGKPLPGPFQGQSMNCRQCHLVDELKPQSPFYVRSYCDFARR